MNARPRIAITLGDPTGIGPEVVAKALSQPDLGEDAALFVVGSPGVLDRAFDLIGSELRARTVSGPDAASESGRVSVISPHNDDGLPALPYGETSPRAGTAAVEWASAAARLAMEGSVDAIATAPISKEAARLAGHEAFGHQEIYQHLAGVPRVLTMLLTNGLNVVHLTTHHPIRDAALYVTRERVLEALRLTHDFFTAHGVPEPRIGVAALNPHGGEAGLIGSEEIEEIRPAVEDANAEGIAATGPVPADSIFGQAIEGRYDAVLAMYHDQGHIAVKVHDWAASITLNIGLPFLRTSVDHGTAFDIAGKGIADATGMVEAIRYAAEVSRTGRLPSPRNGA